MKNSVLSTLRIFGACVVIAVACVPIEAAPVVIATVPFDFVVCNQKLAAGEYSVTVDRQQSIVLLRGEGNGSAMFALSNATQAGKTSQNARLIFKRYNDRYVLWQIFPAGTPEGRELPRSRMEQELARRAGKPDIVSLLVTSPGLRRPAH